VQFLDLNFMYVSDILKLRKKNLSHKLWTSILFFIANGFHSTHNGLCELKFSSFISREQQSHMLAMWNRQRYKIQIYSEPVLKWHVFFDRHDMKIFRHHKVRLFVFHLHKKKMLLYILYLLFAHSTKKRIAWIIIFPYLPVH
jgi:hypothetical protein